jgi:hypothetical protein
MVREGIEQLSFEEALTLEEKRLEEEGHCLREAGLQLFGYKRGGQYAAQLEYFLEEFSDDQFLFLLQEELISHFEATVVKLFEFLEVDEDFIPQRPVVRNPASIPRSKWFHNLLRHPSGISQQILKFFTRRMSYETRYKLKTTLLDLNLKPISYSPMNEEIERNLRAFFADDIRKLEGMIQRDLSHWILG